MENVIKNNTYAVRFYDFFRKQHKKFVFDERVDNRYTFMIPIGTKDIPSVTVFIDVSPSGKVDFNTGLGSVVNIEREFLLELHEVIAKANDMYAFSSFYIDKDDDIRASYNFFMKDGEAFEVLERYLYTFVSVCEDAGPDILSTLWKTRKDYEHRLEMGKYVGDSLDNQEDSDESDDIFIDFDEELDSFEDDDSEPDDFEPDDFEPDDSEDDDSESDLPLEDLFEEKLPFDDNGLAEPKMPKVPPRVINPQKMKPVKK